MLPFSELWVAKRIKQIAENDLMDVSRGFHIYRDGSAWCAVGPHFLDLMKDAAGFGDTPEAAYAALMAAVKNRREYQRHSLPKFAEFLVHH